MLVRCTKLFSCASRRVVAAIAATATPLLLAATASAQSSVAEAAAAEGNIATKNLLDIIVDGGPLMYPIAVCSFVLTVFVFERIIALRRGRVIPGPFVKRFLAQLSEGQIDREKALLLCEENGSPVAQVFAAAVKKWGKTSVEVEQAILDSGERVTNHLRKHLRLLNGIAQVGPLLGLLGTVVGMIVSFNGLSAGQEGQREVLASGIAQALLTTAAGMVVAIPALIAYLYFIGRVDRLIMEIDSLGQEIVEIISAEAIADTKSSRKSKAA